MKIEQPITLNLVKLYKGIVDFYYWKGIAVARRWPRDPHQPGTPKQKKTWDNLTGMYAELKKAPLYYHAAWKDASKPTARTATDLKRKTIMRCLAANLIPKFCKVTGITRNKSATPSTENVLIYIVPQPGKNMADIQWRYRMYSAPKPPIVWIDWGRTQGRTHGVAKDYKPDIEHWSLPLSQSYDSDSTRYELVLPSNSLHFAFAYVVL